MTTIHAGEELVNLETGNVITVMEVREGEHFLAATSTVTGRLVNRRPILKTSVRATLTTRYGKEARQGYIRLADLPAGHRFAPAAPVKEQSVTDMPLEEPDFSEMSDAQIAQYTFKYESRAKALKNLADKAKEEMRRRATISGTRVFDDVAVNASFSQRFDAKLAAKNLTPRQLQAISVSKPDAATARKVLGEDSPAYLSTLAEGTWTMTVRVATDDDREESDLFYRRALLESFVPGDALGDTAPF